MITPLLPSSFRGLLRQIHQPRWLNPSTDRYFTTSTPQAGNSLPPRPTLSDSDLHHVFLKGSGPGGQKINKTNSAVQLTHLPTGIVVKSQATRSRSQNYKIAREILAEKIEHLEKGIESRFSKKIERKGLKKRSKEKKAKRKYRALEEAKNDGTEEGGRGDEDSVGLGDEASDTVADGGEMDKKKLNKT